MLNQAAHDIYNAAAEKTDVNPPFGNEHTTYLLSSALGDAAFWLGMREHAKFDIWIKAVEDLTAIHRAERN